MSSATLGDTSLPASQASSAGRCPAKPRRHVAFFFDGEEISDGEKPHSSRAAGRRGLQSAMTADEHRAWNARAAESDALRQRALQCGEDIARVASRLGYEVVAHTPTAFLKRNSVPVSGSVAVAKPEGGPQRFTAADGGPAHVVDSAAPPSSLSTVVPLQLPPVFLKEDALDSSSSRSSSLGTEEQVGLVPVLSPLLHGGEAEPGRVPDEETLHTFEVALPHALSSHESTTHYFFTVEPSTHPLREDEPNWRDSNDGRSSPFGPLRANVPTIRSDSAANQQMPSSTNSLGERSTPSTTQSTPNASPSPRQSVTPRRAILGRHHGGSGSLIGTNPSNVQIRTTVVNAASSRGASNSNTSVSTEHLNGHEMPVMGPSQSTNRLLTPATDALNTPAVRVADDEIWPRLHGRPIQ
jgi:hypothetical protein